MGSKDYLSFKAEKLAHQLWIGLAIVLAPVAISQWSKVAALVGWVLTDSPRYHVKFVLVTVMVGALAVVLTAELVSCAVALVYDLVTRQGKFDRCRGARERGVNLPIAEEPGFSHPIAPNQLGAVLFSHHFPVSVRRPFLWFIAVVLLLPAFIGACAVQTDYPYNILGPAASVVLLYIIYRLLRANPESQTLRVREGGLEWSTGKETQTYRWSNLAAVRESIMDFQDRAQRAHTCFLKMNDGRKATFSKLGPTGAPNFAPTVEAIHQYSGAFLLPRYVGLLRAAQSLDFGPVMLDGERLHFGVRSILRSEVAKVRVENGRVAIFRTGEKTVPFASFQWSAVWNPWVLVTLLSGSNPTS